MKAFILNTLKHQNPNTSNDSSTKLRKEKIKFNNRGKRKPYVEKISTNTPDYEYHSEPLRQQRRFIEGGIFKGKDSETAKTAEQTNISTKTPDYEYHSEPLRQYRRFVESGGFEEKDSEKNRKTDPIAQQYLKTIFYFSHCIFSYGLYKFFFSVLIKRGFQRTFQFSFQKIQSSRPISRLKC